MILEHLVQVGLCEDNKDVATLRHLSIVALSWTLDAQDFAM